MHVFLDELSKFFKKYKIYYYKYIILKYIKDIYNSILLILIIKNS
jgi:hypothetical protein